MNALFFLLFLLIAYPLSLLPMGALYFLSDGLYLLVYKIFGYRKKIVFTNLKNAFPEKTEEERKEISQKFYKNFCDLLAENLKTLSISKKTILNRCSIENIEVVNRHYDAGRSVLVVVGHYGNWEWAGLFASLKAKHKMRAVYKKLSNPFFDQLMIKLRKKFGMTLISDKEVVRKFFETKNEVTCTVLLADQTPMDVRNAYWTVFLNQDTPVFTGIEKLAKKFNYPVIFCDIERQGRGRYHLALTELISNPKACSDDEITEKHTRFLENIILRHPENWLWTHRRWKRKHLKPQ